MLELIRNELNILGNENATVFFFDNVFNVRVDDFPEDCELPEALAIDNFYDFLITNCDYYEIDSKYPTYMNYYFADGLMVHIGTNNDL